MLKAKYKKELQNHQKKNKLLHTGKSHKAIRKFLIRNIVSHKGVSWHIQRDETEKRILLTKDTLSGKVIINSRKTNKSFPGKQKLEKFY